MASIIALVVVDSEDVGGVGEKGVGEECVGE
jgi:hypothetical protein